MSLGLGIALIGFGITLKSAARLYRYIRLREYIDPNRMYPGGFYQQMNRREAMLILGVQESTDTAAIKLKHRTLMLLNHPDNSGSTYIATKINEAKDLLLTT